MLPSFTTAENKVLGMRIIEHIRIIKNDIMATLKKKYESNSVLTLDMKKIGVFPRDINGDRIVSLFRTILNKKLSYLNDRLDNDVIMDAALCDMKRGTRKIGIAKQKSKEDMFSKVLLLFKKLQQTLSNSPTKKKLKIDDIVLQSRKKKSCSYEEVERRDQMIIEKEKSNYPMIRFTKYLDEQIDQMNFLNNDLIELVSGNTVEDSKTLKNIWVDDISIDPFAMKAKQILNYDADELRRVSACKEEDPLLQARSTLATSNRSKNYHRIHFIVQSRYLKHRVGKNVVFKPEQILTKPISRNEKMTLGHTNIISTQNFNNCPKQAENIKFISSITFKQEPKDRIYDKDKTMVTDMEYGLDDLRDGTVDYLGNHYLIKRCKFV
jgi:hypothetical protein